MRRRNRKDRWSVRTVLPASGQMHVAIEVPLSSPQITYSARCDQWIPRGFVTRCVLGDNKEGQLVVMVDDHELGLEEFGKLLTTRAGWGMRIEFVPPDELDQRPAHEVRELKPEEE